MAIPMTPQQLIDTLRAEGLTVREYPGWRDRCRCHSGSHEQGVGSTGRGWAGTVGTMVHITAGSLGSRSVERYIADIINGDPATPTKAHMVVEDDGTVWLNAAGRANHAGTVSSRAVAALRDGTLSLSGWQDLRGHDTDGNTVLYGIENIAATSMTAAQREASVRICAAIARHYGWDGRDAIGHGEASDQRSYSDPGLDMGQFRRDVMARVANTNTTIQEDDMPALDTPITSAVDGKQYPYIDYLVGDNKRITEIEGSMLTPDTRIGDYKFIDYIIADNQRIAALTEQVAQLTAAVTAIRTKLGA